MKKESVRRAEAREHIKGRAAQVGAAAVIAGSGTAIAATAFGGDEVADEADEVADVVIEPQPHQPAAAAPSNAPIAAAAANSAAPAKPTVPTAAAEPMIDVDDVEIEPTGSIQIEDDAEPVVDVIENGEYDDSFEVECYTSAPESFDADEMTYAMADCEGIEAEEYAEGDIMPDSFVSFTPGAANSISAGVMPAPEPEIEGCSIAGVDFREPEPDGMDDEYDFGDPLIEG